MKQAGWHPQAPLRAGSPGRPMLSTAAGAFSWMSSQHRRVTPDRQELPPLGPFPTIELCLVSLH